MVFVSLSGLAYSTLWIVFLVSSDEMTNVRSFIFNLYFAQPFFDSASPIHDYFPDRKWALRISSLILVLGIYSIGSFLSLSMFCRQNNGPRKGLHSEEMEKFYSQ